MNYLTQEQKNLIENMIKNHGFNALKFIEIIFKEELKENDKKSFEEKFDLFKTKFNNIYKADKSNSGELDQIILNIESKDTSKKNDFHQSLQEFKDYVEKDQLNDFHDKELKNDWCNKKDWFKCAFSTIENKDKIQQKITNHDKNLPNLILRSIFNFITNYFNNLFSSNKKENPRGNLDLQSSEEQSSEKNDVNKK